MSNKSGQAIFASQRENWLSYWGLVIYRKRNMITTSYLEHEYVTTYTNLCADYVLHVHLIVKFAYNMFCIVGVMWNYAFFLLSLEAHTLLWFVQMRCKLASFFTGHMASCSDGSGDLGVLHLIICVSVCIWALTGHWHVCTPFHVMLVNVVLTSWDLDLYDLIGIVVNWVRNSSA